MGRRVDRDKLGRQDPGGLVGWYSLGGSVPNGGAPGATSYGPQMQVFAPGTDGQAYADVWTYQGYQGFATNVGDRWGYILTQGQSYTAPLWISEWGTCMVETQYCSSGSNATTGAVLTDSEFFSDMQQYLKAGDIDFAYWQLGSELVPGRPATDHAVQIGYDYYGLMTTDWAAPSNPTNVDQVEALAMTQGP